MRAGVGVVAAREGVVEGSELGVLPGPSWSPQEDHPTQVDPWQGVEGVQELHTMKCAHQTRQAKDFQKAGSQLYRSAGVVQILLDLPCTCKSMLAAVSGFRRASKDRSQVVH